MPSKPSPWRIFGRDLLTAVFASCGSYFILRLAFGAFAMSPLSESLLLSQGMIGVLLPLASIALASGTLAGVIVGAWQRDHAMRIALLAGLLTCVMQLAIALLVGGVEFASHNYALLGAPCLAVGLVFGVLLSRQVWHA